MLTKTRELKNKLDEDLQKISHFILRVHHVKAYYHAKFYFKTRNLQCAEGASTDHSKSYIIII
jgi:hypothetical protein